MEYLSPKEGGLPITPRRVRSEILLFSLFLAVTLGLIAFCSRLAHGSAVPVVRVMVDREPRAMVINGFDLIVQEAEASRDLAHESRRASITMRCSLGGRIDIDLGGGRRKRANGPVRVSSLGGFIRVGQSQYRDDLYVYSFNGDCIAVNHLDLEKYVAGLLNSEMSAKWSLSALMAQAVAARTYAVYQMREAGSTRYRGLNAPFDLDSSVKDQVYEGAHMERYKAIQAVQLTSGMVLTFQGHAIKAFYHSTCGGQTETSERVWGVRLPYIRSVPCPYCVRSPRYNWVYNVSPDDFARRLRTIGLLRGKLVSVRVVDRNQLGRAGRVEIKGTDGAIVVSATRIRDALGTTRVRSTNFSVAQNPGGGDFVFVGHGSGHGVGMCQWGAKTLGERGRTYAEILKTYYPAADVTKIY